MHRTEAVARQEAVLQDPVHLQCRIHPHRPGLLLMDLEDPHHTAVRAALQARAVLQPATHLSLVAAQPAIQLRHEAAPAHL